MSKFYILLTTIQTSLIWNNISGQTTYWVSNDPSNVEIVQFTSLQTAIDNAEEGDIINIYPSQLSYGNISLTKSITIEGVGYQLNTFLQPSLNIQTIYFNTIVDNMDISNTSAVNIKGLYFGYINIQNTNNITIERSIINYGSIQDNQNILVHGCYIGGGYAGAFNLRFLNTSEIILSNCIFWQNSNTSYHNLHIEFNCGNALVQNCIFSDDVHINNTTFINNIHYQGGLGHTNCTVTNNVSTSEYNGIPPGNLFWVPYESIFVGLPNQGAYSFDNKYQLLPNSLARDYGENGVDCGIFDGDFPYRLSGITYRPIVSELVAPTSTYNDEMEITVRVKIID